VICSEGCNINKGSRDHDRGDCQREEKGIGCQACYRTGAGYHRLSGVQSTARREVVARECTKNGRHKGTWHQKRREVVEGR